MDTYDRYTNLGKKILPLVLPSMVEAEYFSDHPRTLTACEEEMAEKDIWR